MAGQELKWNLYDVVPKGKFDETYSALEKDIAKMPEMIKLLKPQMSLAEFKQTIEFQEDLKVRLSKLSAYGGLWESTDVKSQDAKLFKSRSQDLTIKLSDALLPLEHWLKGLAVENLDRLDDYNANRLFAAMPDLEYVFGYNRAAAKHTLSQGEEKIITRKSITGKQALGDMYDLITDSFEYKFQPKGQKPKTFKVQGQIRNYYYSAKAAEREAAYKGVLKPYRDNEDKLFVIYRALVKDWDIDAQLRNFASPISMRNFFNRVPDKAIETLLEVCRRNVPIYHDFFAYKAKLLKMKKLRRYDLFAPLEAPKSKMPLTEAKKLVLDIFSDFAPGFATKAEAIFKANHIDSHPRSGKDTGAFCSDIAPGFTPYILLNYTGNNSSVATLAHELGHGIHDMYAAGHYYSSSHTTLPLAETASTISELMVFEKLLGQAKSDKERRAMLLEKLGDSYATVIRQAYFVMFENEAHKRISEGVKSDQLSDLYIKHLRSQLGPGVDVAEDFRSEWAYIPHIFQTPFYCYAYNFGELLALALFARYKSDGKPFVSRIEKILAYGGSQSPDVIIKEVGMDMSSPDFWQGSFDVVRSWLDELKRLSK
jgi:oligoendopeptidase F